MAFTLEKTATPMARDLDFLQRSLSDFNDSDVGASDKTPLAIFVRDDEGAVLAGLSGYTAWGWLYVQWLFVSQSLRGEGMAGRMLEDAEAEAVARGCHGAFIDTFNPQALKAYMRQGYEPFGALDDFPKGRSRTFLQKKLAGRAE